MSESESEFSRRKFVKYAGVAGAGSAMAGCTGNDSGGDAGGDSGSDESMDSSGSADEGARPLTFIGPAWAARDAQAELFKDVTGISTEITNATIPTTQQKVLGGEAASFDAITIDTSGAGALVQDNDAGIPVPTDDIEKWNPDVISDLFTNPTERLSYLGKQAETINSILWQDDARTELRFPPHVYNFDAVGYNPEFVDSATLWSDLFDEQYKGKVCMGATASITIPEALMHLVDESIVDGNVGDLNNPTQEQLDSAIDFLIDQKSGGQFRSTWTGYGESVNLMASEEAVIGDLWQPAALDTRRAGTPITYATMETGQNGLQGYRYWFGGITPGAEANASRNNYDEVTELINVHYGSSFPAFIQGYGYSVPQYPNKDLVRTGSDETGAGMGPEYYDWSYEGAATYESVDAPALFDPQSYEWSDEEGSPASDGGTRDSGPIEDRIDKLGFFQIWPDEADYMTNRWRDFSSA